MIENLQSKIEAEILKLKDENLLSIGKKTIPEVARRLSVLLPITPDVALDHPNQPPTSKDVHLKILEIIKERFGGIPTWKIPVEEYLKIVDECTTVE